MRRSAAALVASGLLITLLVACAPDAQATARASCGPRAQVVGATADDLQRALDAARPGDVLALAPVTYRGNFVITTSGDDAPITLCGTPGSGIDGGDVDKGYALHLDHVADWVLAGFRVSGGQKGIVLDGVTRSTLTRLDVGGTGQEAVHLRANSTDNLVDRLTVHDTGRSTPEYGEGIYIGSAASNWCAVTDCQPDRSDRNRLAGNTVSDVTAEAIDIKEGASDGVVSGNTLSVASSATVDSVLDLKGSRWLIDDNRISVSSGTGVQVHRIATPVDVGSGTANTISNNAFTLRGAVVAVEIVGDARRGGNTLSCDNTVEGAQTPAPSTPGCR